MVSVVHAAAEPAVWLVRTVAHSQQTLISATRRQEEKKQKKMERWSSIRN